MAGNDEEKLSAEKAFNELEGPISRLQNFEQHLISLVEGMKHDPRFDARMAAVARTQFELGFLALYRAVKRI